MANLATYGGVVPLRGLHGDRFIKPSSAKVLYSGWCPRKGVTSLASDEPVGRYPTLFTTPRRTINPQRGGNAQDPHGEKPAPSKGREGGHI